MKNMHLFLNTLKVMKQNEIYTNFIYYLDFIIVLFSILYHFQYIFFNTLKVYMCYIAI